MTVREVVDVFDLEIQTHQAAINRLKRKKDKFVSAAQARVKNLKFPIGEEEECAKEKTKRAA